MPARTPIQWTDATWNPIRGCSRVSDGFRYCYAEAVAARFSGAGQAYEGLARRRSNGEPQWTGEVRVIDEHMLDPIRWRRPRRIFVNSMSDLFHEKLSDDSVDAVFAVMALAQRHTFQILTKRPARMLDYLTTPGRAGAIVGEMANREMPGFIAPDVLADDYWPLPNIWLGVSVENQTAADERIPLLVETPAAVRFLSCEPLLGPIDFYACGSRGAEDGDPFSFSALTGTDGVDPPIPGIDWVIVGGESGPHARRLDLAWIRSIVHACKRSSVSVFVKQLGRHPVELERGVVTWPEIELRDSHGGDMEEWPEDLRVREFPASQHASV
jgi:protein gp37